MGAIETKTFKDNGQLAVHLPTDMAFPEGTAVRVEKIGTAFRITAIAPPDPAAEKRRPTELISRLRDIWGDAPRPTYDREAERIQFPDRPGL